MVLQYVAACCSVLQHVAVTLICTEMVSLLAPEAFLVEWKVGGGGGVAVYCSVLQRVAVCCSHTRTYRVAFQVGDDVTVCCSVLQCVAVCCSHTHIF